MRFFIACAIDPSKYRETFYCKSFEHLPPLIRIINYLRCFSKTNAPPTDLC